MKPMFIVNEWAAKYFQDILQNDVDGRAIGMQYFRSRGFRDDIIRKFQLGFSLTRRNTGYPTDFRIGMRSEIGFTSESFLLNMLHSLSHDLIVDGMVELEVIALHVQIDILGGWQFHIIAASS